MLEFTIYLQNKNLSIATIKRYTRLAELFRDWNNSEAINCQKKDVLAYLGYLKNTKNLQTISRNNTLIALRHYFDYLITQNEITQNPTSFIKLRGLQKRNLHYIYTLEELDTIADNYYLLEVKRTQENLQLKGGHFFKRSYVAKVRNHTILLFFIHQGLHTREILRLTTEDIHLQKASVFICKGKTRGNERTLLLHATQIGFVIQYLNAIRPQLETSETENILFLPIPKKDPKAKKQAQTSFKGFIKKLKQLNPNFNSLVQLRASVITHWIKTYGLRKAQYLAGHKNITNTEAYIPNNIEDLAEDITKFNPF